MIHVHLVAASAVVVGRAYRCRSEAIERAMAGLDEAGRQAVRVFLGRVIDEVVADEAGLEQRPGNGRGAAARR